MIHHGRGTPVLGPFQGDPGDLAEFLRRRREMRDGTDRSCEGCPYLATHEWPEPEFAVTWLGITHFNHCNLVCEYCWLQWADYSPRKPGNDEMAAYALFPTIRELVYEHLLSPDAIVDWGGGGESTLMPDFDDCFDLLDDYGVTQWLHTNAVRVPRRLLDSNLQSKLRVLCSLDAGCAETYRAIKGRDRFATVCENLRSYVRAGAYVVVKYIVTEANSSRKELDAFLEFALGLWPAEIVGDIDLRYPNARPEIIEALGYLTWRCSENNLPLQIGSTGINHGREYDIPARAKIAMQRLRRQEALQHA